jgi:hypothetical protein
MVCWARTHGHGDRSKANTDCDDRSINVGAPPLADEELVQANDDGSHVILPVAARFTVRSDHAGMPVMMLRHADGKMRRDGSGAAIMQRHCPVDER